jgi:FKBP-type peptidyl-prolyl cis-trans isomerase 2
MKKTYILLAFALLTLLVSCTQKEEVVQEDSQNQEQQTTTLETNTDIDMAELTGNVVLDMNHALAGKTLIFDVEIMKITKGESNSTEDTVEAGDSIEVHYTGTLEDGSTFDSSRERDQTLPFTVGAGQMIPGFDAGVVGMKLGESQVLTLAAKDAYGEFDETKTQSVPKKDLASFVAAGFKLEVGEKLPTQFGEFEIIEITE